MLLFEDHPSGTDSTLTLVKSIQNLWSLEHLLNIKKESFQTRGNVSEIVWFCIFLDC